MCGNCAYAAQTAFLSRAAEQEPQGGSPHVVCLVADDALKVCGEVWIALYPRAELRVGGYDCFVRTVFFAKWQMGYARVLLEKHIGSH